MRGRRRSSFKRFKRAGKNLIWVTTIAEATLLESSPVDIASLVLPADWSVTSGFDRATLLVIRGWFGMSCTATATITEATQAYAAVYVGQVASTAMDCASAAQYASHDVLWCDGLLMQNNAGTNSTFNTSSRQLEIKAKRRLTSESEVRVCVSLTADTAAAPRVNAGGCFRCLLQTD